MADPMPFERVAEIAARVQRLGYARAHPKSEPGMLRDAIAEIERLRQLGYDSAAASERAEKLILARSEAARINRERAEQAEAAIERVRIIHYRVECSNVRCTEGGWCIGCDPDGADGCSEHPWPCPTVLAVSPDGEVPALYAQWVLRRDYDAVTAERDRLAAALRQHETCRTCGHERHEHDFDGVIRAQYCGRCTVGRDVHDFHPEEQP